MCIYTGIQQAIRLFSNIFVVFYVAFQFAANQMKLEILKTKSGINNGLLENNEIPN